jgi:hypothetical protein
MPLDAITADACNSPVLGLYRYFALLVNMVDGVPVVALANNGNRLLAVVVSLLKLAPAVPFDAAVMRPKVSTVRFVAVKLPAVTPLTSNATVPLVVIVPPVKPVPAVTDVTVPVNASLEVTVKLG